MSIEDEIKQAMELKGAKGRGAALLTHFRYIREREGKRGVEKIEQRLKELGYSVDLEKIRPMDRIPLSISYLVVIVAREVFNWQDSDIFDMGNNAPKYSFIVKMLLGYFISPKKSFEQSPKYWRKHYNVGELEAHQFNEKEKYMVFRLRHQCPSTICVFYQGYFLRIAQYVLNTEKVTIKETKCVSRGDSYHEFIIRWE